jgi:uncharacterized membrane protein YgcG
MLQDLLSVAAAHSLTMQKVNSLAWELLDKAEALHSRFVLIRDAVGAWVDIPKREDMWQALLDSKFFPLTANTCKNQNQKASAEQIILEGKWRNVKLNVWKKPVAEYKPKARRVKHMRHAHIQRSETMGERLDTAVKEALLDIHDFCACFVAFFHHRLLSEDMCAHLPLIRAMGTCFDLLRLSDAASCSDSRGSSGSSDSSSDSSDSSGSSDSSDSGGSSDSSGSGSSNHSTGAQRTALMTVYTTAVNDGKVDLPEFVEVLEQHQDLVSRLQHARGGGCVVYGEYLSIEMNWQDAKVSRLQVQQHTQIHTITNCSLSLSALGSQP